MTIFWGKINQNWLERKGKYLWQIDQNSGCVKKNHLQNVILNLPICQVFWFNLNYIMGESFISIFWVGGGGGGGGGRAVSENIFIFQKHANFSLFTDWHRNIYLCLVTVSVSYLEWFFSGFIWNNCGTLSQR